MSAAAEFAAGRAAGEAAALPATGAVRVMGMGGSGIVGALVAHSRPRVETRNDPTDARAPVDRLVLVSHSGGTEETLSWVPRWGAESRAVTRGGALGDEAAAAGVPVVRVAHPGPPRRALYEMLGALDGLVAAAEEPLWDSEPPDSADLSAAAATARAWAEQDRLPWVLGHAGNSALARRWAGQLQEDAKTPGGVGVIPEAAHNQLEALGGAPMPVGVVLLGGGGDSGTFGRVQRVLEARGVPCWAPDAAGLVPLCLVGDAFALAWAEARGVEPDPIPTITAFKSA